MMEDIDMDDMHWVPTYDEVDTFLRDNQITTLTQDIYDYIIGGDFTPEDDPTTFD